MNEIAKETERILDMLEPDLHLATIKRFLHYGITDIRLIIRNIIYTGSLVKNDVNTYLEIGVRRGYSMAMVGYNSDVTIHGIDPWIANYGGAPNPGPEFVKQQMKRVNHTGELVLFSNYSNVVLPDLPDNYDLITIDGDHSYEGAMYDLRQCINKFNLFLLIDDIDIDKDVRQAWLDIQKEYPDFYYHEFDMVGVVLSEKSNSNLRT
jgi:hypothetical protein